MCPSHPSEFPDKFKSHVTDAVNSITVDILQQVREENEYRLDECRASKKGCIEHS